MRVAKALQIVLIRWQITAYRLSAKSGIGRPTLSRILNEQNMSFSWATIETLADGLGAIDPTAKTAFLAILSMRDEDVPKPPEPDLNHHIHDIAQFAVEMAEKAGEPIDPMLKEAAIEAKLDYHYFAFMDWVFDVMGKYNPKPEDYIPPHRLRFVVKSRSSRKKAKKDP